jgi:siroheme synthase
MIKFLDELKKLDFPRDKFAVFASGCLAVRGIRENNDIDIIVKDDLWQKLIKKYPRNEKGFIHMGNIEAGNKALYPKESVDEMIDNADIIEKIRFVKLKSVLIWKRLISSDKAEGNLNRDKDKTDIKLIENYLAN